MIPSLPDGAVQAVIETTALSKVYPGDIALVGRPSTTAVELTGTGGLQVRTSDFGAFCAQIAAITRDNDIALRELLPTDESLESVFGYLISSQGS